MQSPTNFYRKKVALPSWLAISIYVLVALMWVIPDKRIEKMMPESH
jgi:hypothetical protein